MKGEGQKTSMCERKKSDEVRGTGEEAITLLLLLQSAAQGRRGGKESYHISPSTTHIHTL